MTSGGSLKNGLVACEGALERLLDGKPVVPAHVGLALSKLTASIVSLEAGFDRGYLKKSRKAHLPLLAKIEAFRAEPSKATVPSSGKQIKRLESRLSLLGHELSIALAQRDRVLTQNLQLWERVRELERSNTDNRTAKVEPLRWPH